MSIATLVTEPTSTVETAEPIVTTSESTDAITLQNAEQMQKSISESLTLAQLEARQKIFKRMQQSISLKVNILTP